MLRFARTIGRIRGHAMIETRVEHLTNPISITAVVVRLGEAGFTKKAAFDAVMAKYLVDLDLLAEAMNAFPFPQEEKSPVSEPDFEERPWTVLAGTTIRSLASNCAPALFNKPAALARMSRIQPAE